ncbi:MAG: HAD family hydrolase [Ruminococcaceae bacterium]|nr:HAD family hydrolase [Oscillospiraceae bacterium]
MKTVEELTKDKKLYIFDFDGVIADTGNDIAACVQKTQAHFGAEILSKDEIILNVGLGAKHLIEKTVCNSCDVTLDEAVSWYADCFYENCVVETVIYDGFKYLLETLREQGHSMCVVTNKPLRVSERSLELLGIREFFDVVMCPENTPKMKPAPDGLLISMFMTGFLPENTVMVGDSASDIEAGKAAGVKTCGVLYGIGNTEKLLAADADVYVNSPAEILSVW